MPIHIDWGRGDLPAVWREFHGPLIAFAVALGLALAGRLIRSGWLAAAAGGAGVAAGWYAISGRVWVTSPRPTVDHLTLVAAVALVVGLLATRLASRQGAILGLLLAAFTGWWLCGAPRSQPALTEAWLIGLGVVIVVLVYARSLATDALYPLRPALTALTMAAAFHIAVLPPLWIQLALVPALASLALLALPPMPGLVALPIAVDIAAVASLAVIVLGRLPHLRVGPVDVAVAAPLLALWLAPRLIGRIGFAGRAAAAGASVLAALIALGCTWIAVRVLAR